MSENTIIFRTIEECSICIINRFLEIEPQAEKWDLEDQAARIAEFTQMLSTPGTITCIMHDIPGPRLSTMFTIECSD